MAENFVGASAVGDAAEVEASERRRRRPPTPFGLFSGVSPGTTGDCTRLQVGQPSTYERHTRLDNDYLFALCEALEQQPALKAALRYAPNSSLYHAAGRIRYAEARLSGTRPGPNAFANATTWR